MVSVPHVNFTEDPSAIQTLQKFVRARYRVEIVNRLAVKGAIIDTHTETTILLLSEEDGGPVWTVRWFDASGIHEVRELPLELRELYRVKRI